MLVLHSTLKCKQAGDVLFLTNTTGDVRIGEVSGVTNNLELELTGNGLVAVTGGTVKRFSAELLRPDKKF